MDVVASRIGLYDVDLPEGNGRYTDQGRPQNGRTPKHLHIGECHGPFLVNCEQKRDLEKQSYELKVNGKRFGGRNVKLVTLNS